MRLDALNSHSGQSLGSLPGIRECFQSLLSTVKYSKVSAKTKLTFFSLAQESIDESFIKEAILTRLGDNNIDVVLSAINAFEVSEFVVH